MPYVYAIDFDLTLTLIHTYPTFSILERGQKIPCPEHSLLVTDEEVFTNLRNPYAMRYLISYLIKNQNEVFIVSMHDNIPWIKRNLTLLMGGENTGLINRIKIIALQAAPYDEKYSGSKLAAIRGESKNSAEFVVIDDDEKELRKLQELTDNLIQVKPDSDDYLNKIALLHSDDNTFLTCLKLARYKDQREKRTSSEYYHGFFSKFFGGYSKKEKFEAVDALIESLSNSEQHLSVEYIKFLKQGELGKLVKKLDIDLDALLHQKPNSEKLVRLKNGISAPEKLVEATISALHTLQKEDKDLFSVLVRKCREPEYDMSPIEFEMLRLRHFIHDNHTASTMSDIVLSAVEGEYSNLIINSPIEASSSQSLNIK